MKKFVTLTVALIMAASQFLKTEDIVSAAPIYSIDLDGKVSYNVLDNEYTGYALSHASVMNSYIFENSDGTFTRVENIHDEIAIENYTENGKMISTQNVEFELDLFGGFFCGEDSNYFVFGQSNPDYDNNAEVVRVVKYSKDWNRISEASLYGANTYIPFDAGSLRMTETAGKLYIHTCHEMYASSDGLNHQANLTFVVDEENMKITQSNYAVTNIEKSGYVSHSFNQYIQNDGQYIYRLDHGDAYPRAICITKCASSNIKSVKYMLPFKISGITGDNYTGVAIGGFELSEKNCLIVGNSVNQEESAQEDSAYYRNIFLIVASKSLNNSKTIWLTDYTEDDNMGIGNPQLVKYDNDKFVIMWHEVNGEYKSFKYAVVNSNGEMLEGINSIAVKNYSISDCQPVKFNDGTIKWYSTDNESVSLYTLNLDSHEVLIGDLNGDSKYDTKDYMIMLKLLLGEKSISDEQIYNADINADGIINVLDIIYLKELILG